MPKIKNLVLHYKHSQWNIGALIERIATHKRLETLVIDFYDRIGFLKDIPDSVAKLTNLKKLELKNAKLCSDATLANISCIETLEELKIWTTKVTNVGIEELIRRCKAIRYIDAKWCRALTGELIPKISKHLEGRQHKLVLDITGMGIPVKKYKGTYDPRTLEIIH